LIIKLVKTCEACPEQYEAFYNGKKVGYLRLRHGEFRVDYPDCGGKIIYEARPNGDGSFEDDEREFYLEQAKEAIKDKLLNDNNGCLKELKRLKRYYLKEYKTIKNSYSIGVSDGLDMAIDVLNNKDFYRKKEK